jgi:hypothetical protein
LYVANRAELVSAAGTAGAVCEAFLHRLLEVADHRVTTEDVAAVLEQEVS